MNFVELDKKSTLEALALAQKRGIRGGRIHDWMHARAASKAGVSILVTDKEPSINKVGKLAQEFCLVVPQLRDE